MGPRLQPATLKLDGVRAESNAFLPCLPSRCGGDDQRSRLVCVIGRFSKPANSNQQTRNENEEGKLSPRTPARSPSLLLMLHGIFPMRHNPPGTKPSSKSNNDTNNNT